MRFNMIFPLSESRSLSVPHYFDGPFPDKSELNSWHLTPSIYSVGAGVHTAENKGNRHFALQKGQNEQCSEHCCFHTING